VKLSELIFDALAPASAERLAREPYLTGLTALKVDTVGRAENVVQRLVIGPTWAGLRALTLPSLHSPDAIQALARSTLEELESLSFGIAEVPDLFSAFGGLTGTIGAMISEMIHLFGRPGPVRWPDYWPALEALARSPVLPRLKHLRVTGARPFGDTTIGAYREIEPEATGAFNDDGVFPDPLVRALADGLDPDRLVRLELPAARISPASRAELTQRFGPRVVLA
jgi:hypothetical protein